MLGSRWIQKPPVGVPIDPSHPLARGLLAFWALAEGTGLPADRVSGAVAASTNATWIVDTPGAALKFNGTSQYVNLGASTPWLSITGPSTIAAFASPAASGTQVLYGGWQPSSPFPGAGMRVVNAGSGQLAYASAGTNLVVPATVDGNWHTWGISQAGGGTNQTAFYEDGRPIGTGTIALPSAWTGQRALGARGDLTAQGLAGSLGWVAIWSRALSPDEHAALASNPWQVFRPRSDAARLNAAESGRRVSYPRGSSALLPFHLPTVDLQAHLD